MASLMLLCNCSDAPKSVVSASQIVDDAIPASITGLPGDEDSGALIFAERESGHCVLCHQIEDIDQEFQGNLGPDLTYVGERLSPGQIRLRIVDYQRVKPRAVMPSYYRLHDLYDVGPEYVGDTYLSAQQVEDLVAYLAARKE